jgi:hypothetical protein
MRMELERRGSKLSQEVLDRFLFSSTAGWDESARAAVEGLGKKTVVAGLLVVQALYAEIIAGMFLLGATLFAPAWTTVALYTLGVTLVLEMGASSYNRYRKGALLRLLLIQAGQQ